MKEKEVSGQMLGVSLLIFVILLMVLFVVASFFVSKQQTTNPNKENGLHDLSKEEDFT